MALLDPPDGLIPTETAELTVSWLHEALRSAGFDPPAIESIEFEELGVEVLTSSIVRVRLRYASTHDGVPDSLIWKRSHSDGARQAAFAHGYVREVEFYREIAPTIDVSVPRCYVAAFDESTNAHVLLLEDLAAARRGDFLEGIDIAGARGVVRELARLHAARWSEPRPLPVQDFERMREFIERYTEVSRSYLEIQIDDQISARNERYGPSVAGWFAQLSEAPQTLCHGDAHAANMMFPRSPEERPYLLDWQGWRVDSGVRDLARFIILGMSIEERRAQERALLASYLEELRARGVQYEASDAERHYRVASTLQWGWAVGFFRHEPIWDASTREAMPELVRRAAAAFDDAVVWLDGQGN